MKIAIPSKNNIVDQHFGHCEYFTIATIVDDAIQAIEQVPSPAGCGCKTNIIETLKEKGVSVMIAGNMGQGAVDKINSADIKVIRGCSGPIEDVIKAYIKGEIVDADIICDHHSHDNNAH